MKMMSVTFSYLCIQFVFGISVGYGQTTDKKPYQWQKQTINLVDQERNRRLTTDIYTPSVENKDPNDLPLIIYSHGMLSTKAENQALLEELAGEGFRIAASNSPRANRADDLEDKAKDMEFLFEYMNGQAKNSIMLGYSLGSLSAILAGAEINTAGVIAIAPPTHEFERLGIPVPTPFNPEITMIIGANDSVAPTQYSIPFAKDFTPQGDTFIIEGGTHMGFIAGWGNPATVDAFLCQRFKRESHYPADYRCPPAKSNSIARRAQQGQATKIVWDTLKKWNFL